MTGRGPKLIHMLRKPRGGLGLHVLPNIVTVAAMLCGFFAIIRTAAGDFPTACLFILLAAILDGLDGKIARMASAKSEIGSQYDSLSDMTSFGVAPAFMLHSWAAPEVSAAAIITAAIFLSCAGLRLARFNLGGQSQAGPFYRGLPSPAAACALGGLIWIDSLVGEFITWLAWLMPLGGCLFALGLAVLMISNIKYYKFQHMRSPRDQSENFLSLILAAGVFGFLLYSPAFATFALASGYVLAGLARPLARLLVRQRLPAAARKTARTDARSSSQAGRKSR